jgi:hypothetical protein
MAHQRADAAQAVLSAVKIFVALLPDHTTRELGRLASRLTSCSGRDQRLDQHGFRPLGKLVVDNLDRIADVHDIGD